MAEPTAVSFDESSDSLRLEFGDLAAATAFIDAAIEQRGFLVTLDRELQQHRAVGVRLEVASVFDLELDSEVAQRFGGTEAGVSTAFLLRGWGEERAREVRAVLALAARRAAAAEVEVTGLPGLGNEDVEGDVAGGHREAEGETQGVSTAHRLKRMNPGQKAILATRAGRAEVQILLRESSPQVLSGLLVNPRIERKDVLRLVKSTHATGSILQRVAQDPRWGKNPEILANVVRNPKTPTPLATRLVERLRTSDLRLMAKMSGELKDLVRRAALREYMKRGSR